MTTQQTKPTRRCLSFSTQKLIRWIAVSTAVGLVVIGVSVAVCTAIGAVIGVAMNDMATIPWGFIAGAALGAGIMFALSMAVALVLALAPAFPEAFRQRH